MNCQERNYFYQLRHQDSKKEVTLSKRGSIQQARCSHYQELEASSKQDAAITKSSRPTASKMRLLLRASGQQQARCGHYQEPQANSKQDAAFIKSPRSTASKMQSLPRAPLLKQDRCGYYQELHLYTKTAPHFSKSPINPPRAPPTRQGAVSITKINQSTPSRFHRQQELSLGSAQHCSDDSEYGTYTSNGVLQTIEFCVKLKKIKTWY